MNKKYTQENLLAIVNLAASGSPSNIDQARAVGVSEDSLREWKFRSNSGDPEFIIPWLGRDMQFAEALAIAKRFHYNAIRERTESWLTTPRKRPTLFQGRRVVALDPRAVPLDAETRIMLGYHPEAYMLDENGVVVWETEEIEAPAAILIKFLETFKDLQPTSTVNSNVNVSGMVGVGVAKPVDYSATMVIPPPPPIPIATPVTEADFDEVDPELADMIDGAPDQPIECVVPVDLTGQPPPFAEPEPEQLTSPEPVGFADPPRREPKNEWEREIFAKLAAMKAKPKGGAANV